VRERWIRSQQQRQHDGACRKQLSNPDRNPHPDRKSNWRDSFQYVDLKLMALSDSIGRSILRVGSPALRTNGTKNNFESIEWEVLALISRSCFITAVHGLLKLLAPDSACNSCQLTRGLSSCRLHCENPIGRYFFGGSTTATPEIQSI
jgi:hypothetical protein